MTKILIFGGTGRTGIYVVRSTVTNNDEVILFVRSPDKVESDVRDKVQIIQGDFLDLAAIKNCVQTTQPDAIIFTTSVVRYGRIQSLNATTVPAIVDELKSEGRLGSVRLIYLSGAATLAKGESLGILGYFSPLIGYLIGASGSIADNNETVKYLESYLEKDSEINFTVVRMGMVLDVKSKGKLVPYLNSGGSFGDAVTFADIGVLLAELAQNNDAYKHKIFPVKYLK